MTKSTEAARSPASSASMPAQTRRRLAQAFLALFMAVSGGVLHAQASRDLTSLSVDDLMNVEVTSVSRKGQKVADTAAAVFVISQEDIRRSGATSIPEVLRIVPGLDVARINGNVWAISARGFNGQFANKLLVMIDGRSVYTPLFSGVYWDVQDTMLEDVDRIEVIRGPGGTLWGANAVNGIINIITKHAIETQGALLSAGGGTAEGSSGTARYGGAVGHNGYYRAYAKSFDHPSSFGGVNETFDSQTGKRAGFRADWTSRGGDNFTLQGDIYRGTAGNRTFLVDPTDPFIQRTSLTDVSGENVQLRWTDVQSSRSDTSLRATYDYAARSDPSIVTWQRTADLDFQHHLKVGRRNDLVWGAEYRVSDDRAGGPGVTLMRSSNITSIASAFVQDEVALTRRVRLTLGTKLEHDDVTGVQLQPTLRLLFKASERQTVWASATSAVRTPAETDLYGRIVIGSFRDGAGNPGFVVLTGNPRLQPERIESYEAGYRWQGGSGITFDATAFYNHLQDLEGTEVQQPLLDSAGRTIVPVRIVTGSSGRAHGAELLVTDAVTPRWNVDLGYSLLRMSVHNDHLPGSAESPPTTPRNQLQLRSSVQLPRSLSWDSSVYYVGRIGSEIPSYVRLDAQLSWHPNRRWEVSLSGQNLLQAEHVELLGTASQHRSGVPIRRAINGKVTWRF